MSQRRRSIVALCLAAVATMLVALVGTVPQADATSYRYWTYWVGGDGDWTFSSQGAAHRPADGSVEGWRFSVSEAASSSDTPRLSSSFDDLCSQTKPVDGRKRVGLVLDFGVSTDAPPGESPPNGPVARCLVLPLAASGYDVLVAASTIRIEEGLVCGIAGYPKTGCGEAVAAPKPTKTDGGSSGGKPPAVHHHPSDQPPANQSGSGDPAHPGPTATTDPVTDGTHHPNKGSSGHDTKTPTAPSHPSAHPAKSERVDAAAALRAELPDNQTSSGSPLGVILGLAAVAALLTAAVVTTRRRR